MKSLLTITDQDINSNAPKVDSSNFSTRHAARGIVIDGSDNIYLLHLTTQKTHKLPGGGIDEGEKPEQAMIRECLEEIGCHVEIIAELGEVVEYRDEFELIQTSYCFVAKQLGKQIESSLEESEIADGFKEVKAQNIADAIQILESDKPNNYVGSFIQKRDLAILKEAKKIIES